MQYLQISHTYEDKNRVLFKKIDGVIILPKWFKIFVTKWQFLYTFIFFHFSINKPAKKIIFALLLGLIVFKEFNTRNERKYGRKKNS